MKIGIMAINSQLGTGGGINVYTRGLVEALANCETQHKYCIIIEDSKSNAWTHHHWPTHIQFVPLHSVEPHQSIWVRVWRRLRRLLKLSVPPHHGEAYIARQIDALELDLLHYPRTTIWPLSVNRPCVLTFFDLQHEYYPQFFTQRELEYRVATYRPSVDKARHILVPSDYTRRTLIEKYDTPAHKMTLIPVGIANTFHRADNTEVERIKKKYGLPDTFIFYPANPWQHKNHARLIAALRIYQEYFGDTPWLVVSGHLRGEKRDVLSLAIAAGVENNVLELGFVPPEDLPALYSAATLLVFPSLFEGFGIPLVEAMACGCPIVAADATTIPEITDGAALLFDPFDSGSIAKAVHRLLVDPDLCETLVQRGYERIGSFKWERTIPQIEKVYEQTFEKTNQSS